MLALILTVGMLKVHDASACVCTPESASSSLSLFAPGHLACCQGQVLLGWGVTACQISCSSAMGLQHDLAVPASAARWRPRVMPCDSARPPRRLARNMRHPSSSFAICNHPATAHHSTRLLHFGLPGLSSSAGMRQLLGSSQGCRCDQPAIMV